DRVVARTVQPLPRDGLADKTRVKTEIARIGRRIAVDIRVDLEIGAEIGIALEEGRVPIGRTNKDHLYIKRYRPRLRRAGDGRALRPAELFDADHAIAQRAFEESPACRIGGDRLGAQHQHAAIGAVQRAGADLQEIGMKRALALAIFDPAEEMLVGRIGLDDHRRMGLFAVIDQQIDDVAPLREFAFGGAAGLELETLRRLGDVDAHRGEPAAEAGVSSKVTCERVERGADDFRGDAAIELLDLRRELRTRAAGADLDARHGGIYLALARFIERRRRARSLLRRHQTQAPIL